MSGNGRRATSSLTPGSRRSRTASTRRPTSATATRCCSAPRGRWRRDAWVTDGARRSRPPYARAALEAAAIDLGLRQARTDLFRLFGVTPQPVRYVVSFGRVADPAAEGRRYPGVELKID